MTEQGEGLQPARMVVAARASKVLLLLNSPPEYSGPPFPQEPLQLFVRPAWLSPVLHPLLRLWFRFKTRKRLEAFDRFLQCPLTAYALPPLRL